jgi:short subunit dehydrogenase-like uncharacterized protein
MAAGLVVGRRGLQAAGEPRHQFCVDLLEARLHLAQRDQRQDRLGILIRPECAVGPELVRRLEEALGEV